MADIWSTLSGGRVHSGSWFGLPEFGLTERVYAATRPGAPLTAQGGSNLWGSSGAQTQPGSVLGMSSPIIPTTTFGDLLSQNRNSNTSPYSNPNPNPPPSTGGGAGPGYAGNIVNQTVGAPGGSYRWTGRDWVFQPSGGGSSPEELARQQAQLELEQTLAEYDRMAAEAQSQKEKLGTQKASTLSELTTGYGQAEKQAGLSRTEAQEATQTAKAKALTTAQDVQRKNRNVLRALGILSSSAAGEMLARPMEEYQSQAGQLETGLIKRKEQVDDWLKQRLTEYNQAKTNLENQYGQLIGDIDRDLRFNDRQRITAVKAAQVAAQQAVAQLQAQAQAYQQVAQQYSAGILSQLAEIKLYQNPQADVSGIYNTLLSMAPGTYQSPQVGQTLSEEQRRRLLGL